MSSSGLAPSRRLFGRWRVLWLLAALVIYLALAGYQLGLPGLHYDEAKEAGVNAMQLLTGAPLTPFRDAALHIASLDLPLMVQDYIGALNVYLALPFLAVTGIGVPNLRLLSLLTGLAALVLLERAVSEWVALNVTPISAQHPTGTPISLAGLLAITLLVASPSFVFWSRQGIFVTNLVQPLSFWSIWQGIRWLRSGQERHLLWSALAAGLALYAKLLALWVIGAFALLVAAWWAWRQFGRRLAIGVRRPGWPDGIDSHQIGLPLLRPLSLAKAGIALALPLLPLLIFNLQTGGTLQAVGGNLGQSYYGVNNANLLQNLPVRLGQLAQSLRGDQFWYLGGSYANGLAPWLAALAVISGIVLGRPAARRLILPPLALLSLAVSASLFTVSDLFVTHYALIQPLAVSVVGLALSVPVGNPVFRLSSQFRRSWPSPGSVLVMSIVALWLVFDLSATLRYHVALNHSGGLADHSDASYHLAYYLRYHGLGAPIALDWGIDAPVRFLSQGTVTPIEIFGYTSLAVPDDDFALRLSPFLDNPDNVYLLHAPDQTVFAGRRQAFLDQVRLLGHQASLETTFSQRDGVPIIEVWRVR